MLQLALCLKRYLLRFYTTLKFDNLGNLALVFSELVVLADENYVLPFHALTLTKTQQNQKKYNVTSKLVFLVA